MICCLDSWPFRPCLGGGGGERFFFFTGGPESSLGGPEIRHFVHKIPTFETLVPVRTSEYRKTLSLPFNGHLNTIPRYACSRVFSCFSLRSVRYISHMHATSLTIYSHRFITVTVLGEVHKLYGYQIVFHATSIYPHTFFRFRVPIKFVCLLTFAARYVPVKCNSAVSH
jgi:hypothetical protein